MNQTIRYKVIRESFVTEKGLDAFSERIEHHLQQGWSLHGSPSFTASTGSPGAIVTVGYQALTANINSRHENA